MLETVVNVILIPLAIKAFQFFWAKVKKSKYEEHINDVRRVIKVVEQTKLGSELKNKSEVKLETALMKLKNKYKWARKIDFSELKDIVESEVFNLKQGK